MKTIHVVFIMANNTSVPYFSWFASKSREETDVKISFIAMVPHRPEMVDEMKLFGCDCYWVNYNSSKRIFSSLRAVPTLVKLFRRIRPDVVHTHLFDDSLPGLLAARLAGVRTRVITKQDTGFHWFYARKGIWFDRFNNFNATHIVAVSGECMNFILTNEKAPPEKVSLIHHGIPTEMYQRNDFTITAELAEKYRLKGRKVIGTVARLIAWKGYADIIKAAAEVIREEPSVLFLFVGSGDQKQELTKLIRQHHLDEHILFTNWIRREEIPFVYRLMDVFLHAAYYEPFGFVIAEAMISGAPVVSTSTGAAADAILHLHNGYLVPYHQPRALADGILYMLRNRGKAAEMAEKGKVTAIRMYSFEKMFDNYIKLYKKAVFLKKQLQP